MVDSVTAGLQLVDQETGNNDNTWGDIADANWGKIEDAIVGVNEIITTGGTLTVLSDDDARPYVQKVTGTLLSDCIVQVQARVKSWIFINATAGAPTLTVKTVAGTGVQVPAGSFIPLLCDGTNVVSMGTAQPLTSAGAIVTVASATTTDIGAANSNTVNVTGTTTITSFGTAAEGTLRYVYFSGALILTHGANLALPGGANITTGAGDWAIMRSSGAGVWSCISFSRASGATIATSITVSGAGSFGSLSTTGSFTISNTAPTMTFFDTDWGAGAPRYIHANGGTIGFLTSAAGWALQVDNSGNTTATGNVGAYSDIKFKTDIETITGALAIVEQLRGVRYTRKDTGVRRVGVIAQEIQRLIPEVVYEGADGLAVNYGDIVGVLIEAIHDLAARIRVLEFRA